ncbi:NAD(P)H-hydrate dehydratase [Corynebacterium felinum]|uniref:ADP-dependent (S)-NAD(P)H-hydrate dehydratase n=1 Tax=Corynebacterium felinum TaxID=131318 RepID=A0ABU2B845_9CORY|nr:bifunctional ADP-dependent NAD(P)H-hydrate dehydratase/NAD(P)H-hydrate epimerase [Corynebacterium felinum]MDF5820753.1 NAD(P)H-hydrate dehydratase [Corynebacterium felinum]MDR7354194.1 hydroxyethylthiazole kinase-like uncharacterized protein yjeF [Corynebacterium felinum]WJY96363.1 Bifunctional NAD(P)H-hydrate repair enzyme Nnr [Corynebacterium felinum]
MYTAYSIADIRAAEAPLIALAEQHHTDGLMRKAAQAVATLATTLNPQTHTPILLLVGAGGNGGDALYAGTILLNHGYTHIHAYLSTPPTPTKPNAHPPALTAFTNAGGEIITELPHTEHYTLIIDGILGIGGTGNINPTIATYTHTARTHATILSIDIPSGIDPHTGITNTHHIHAHHTITFGAARPAHLINTHSGQLHIADISTHNQHLSTQLATYPTVGTHYTTTDTDFNPHQLGITGIIPTPTDHKYSSGVVGIVAGSTHYPGAAMLSVEAAIRATPAMVRYIGDCTHHVLARTPEAVAHPEIPDTTTPTHAWVAGPGGCTTSQLATLIERDQPLLCDAEALRAISTNPTLRDSIVQRNHPTIFTPHTGEFAALSHAYGTPALDDAGLTAIRTLAEKSGATIILKGRKTLIAQPDPTQPFITIDPGHSWGATPGSGDVLAGVLGAWIAHHKARNLPILNALQLGIHITNLATSISTRTPAGTAPTSATFINGAIREATAMLLHYEENNR